MTLVCLWLMAFLLGWLWWALLYISCTVHFWPRSLSYLCVLLASLVEQVRGIIKLLFGTCICYLHVICELQLSSHLVLLVLAHGLAFLHFAEVWHPFQEVCPVTSILHKTDIIVIAGRYWHFSSYVYGWCLSHSLYLCLQMTLCFLRLHLMKASQPKNIVMSRSQHQVACSSKLWVWCIFI